ncbi:MAG: YybH family protein [Longimicrobiales bacterium]
MKSMPLLRALILVACQLAVACQPQSHPPSDPGLAIDTAAIRGALDSLGAVVMEADQSGNAELYASTWAEDGVLITPGTPPIYGRDSIVAAFRRRPPLPDGATLTIHPTEMRILNAEWVYVFGVDTLSYALVEGAEAVTETLTFLVLVRRTPDGWQTYREVLSPDQSQSALFP